MHVHATTGPGEAARRGTPAVWLLVGWTLFVWTFRVGTIWGDDGTTAAKVGRTALALSFTALALTTAVLAARRSPRLVAVVGLLTGWSIAVWVVRAAGILLGDHDAAFVVVHLVLGALSVAVAVVAYRSVHGGTMRPPWASRSPSSRSRRAIRA